ncbi:MAG: hypothetical protein OXF25_02600 [Cyanobacteria bacterium MAG CAR3_bin_5]|nr:hypothetical protein [Cyanobacteria bacterium MAG CAR4_bin_6]MCY4172956.1 hypothetical protein [Cyanobacteria bacterium MAG CAR3_bin_5]
MASSLANGAPTLAKSGQQLSDNIGLFLFSFFLGFLLSPTFHYYPMSMAYVHGKYPSPKEFRALVFSKRYIMASLWGWLLVLIPVVGLAATPFYSHYVFTTDDQPSDIIRDSLSKSVENPLFIGKTILYGLIAWFGCGVGQIITIPLSYIQLYNEAVHEKLF